MVLFNFLAKYLPLNGITRFEIIESIPIYFLPSIYVYNVWYVIYIGLIIFCIYLLFSKKDIEKDLIQWLLVTYSANIVWVFVWHYGLTALAVIAVLIQFLSLIQVYIRINKYKKSIFPYGIFSLDVCCTDFKYCSCELYSKEWRISFFCTINSNCFNGIYNFYCTNGSESKKRLSLCTNNNLGSFRNSS